MTRHLAIAILMAAGSAILLIAATANMARSHEQYPASCCHSAAEVAWGDCAPIASKFVSTESDGYHVNLPIGSHPKLKTKGYSGVIPYGQERPLDHEYHICLSDNGGTRYCFFAPPGSS